MSRLTTFLAILASLILLLSCEKDGGPTAVDPPSNPSGSSISFYFQKPAHISHLIATARAVVSAPDMDTIFTDLTVTDTTVSGTIEEIPAGQHRHFEILVYDSTQALTYYGDAYADVPAGAVLTLYITLYPVSGTGTVIIVGTFVPYPPAGGKIVFLADYTGLDDIYIMNSDGSGIVNLTDTPDNREYEPHISPDRQHIVFAREISPSFPRHYIMNIDGTNAHELNIHPGAQVSFLDWSPDGQKLTVVSSVDGDEDIYTYDLNTHQINQLTFNQARDWMPIWSPAGDWIVYCSDESGNFRVYLVRPDGTEKHLLTNTVGMEERRSAFSPDGSQIVFVGRDNASAWDLFRIDLDGSNLVRVTNTPDMNEFHHCWGPDQNQVLFIREFNYNLGIYLLDLNNNTSTPLLDTPNGNEDFPHWR